MSITTSTMNSTIRRSLTKFDAETKKDVLLSAVSLAAADRPDASIGRIIRLLKAEPKDKDWSLETVHAARESGRENELAAAAVLARVMRKVKGDQTSQTIFNVILKEVGVDETIDFDQVYDEETATEE